MEELEFMPEEYKGKEVDSKRCSTGFGGNDKRRLWTKEEEEWLMDKVDLGYSSYDIAEKMGRKRHSVSLKIKRLKKKNGTYNERHIEDKYQKNKEFYKHLSNEYQNTLTVMDCFCGTNRYWRGVVGDKYVTDNDISKTIDSDYNLDALDFMDIFEGNKFDIVDIDPYGSAYDYIDKAYQLSKKGLIITLGEMGHKRWKRLDFVKDKYGINSIEDFSSDNLVKYILNKYSDLELFELADYENISRAYFIKH